MNAINYRTPVRRIGFHYFPDTQHYRQSDLQTWLPLLHELGAGWLTLQAPDNRAIPEAFIRGLIDGGAEGASERRFRGGAATRTVRKAIPSAGSGAPSAASSDSRLPLSPVRKLRITISAVFAPLPR